MKGLKVCVCQAKGKGGSRRGEGAGAFDTNSVKELLLDYLHSYSTLDTFVVVERSLV